jgi:hypothetical protein
MLVVVPGIGRYGTNKPVLSAGTWTFDTAWATLPSTLFPNDNAYEVRIVSFGCIFRSTASATNCSGLVNMFVLPNPLVSATINSLSVNYPETTTVPMTSGMERSWISKPEGSGAHHFRLFTEATTTMSNFDWSSLVIEISGGAASTTVAVVEIIMNIEMTLKTSVIATTGLPGAITKPRPANPVATQIQTAVHSKTASFFTGGVEKVEKAITTAAADAFDALGSFGLGLLGL